MLGNNYFLEVILTIESSETCWCYSSDVTRFGDGSFAYRVDNIIKVLIQPNHIHGLESGSLRLGLEERVRRLNRINVLVEMNRKRPFWCSDQARAILVLENRVLGVKQPFNILDWKRDCYPIFCSTVLKLAAVNPAVVKPFMDLVKGFIGWLDQLIHLLC